MGRLRTLLALDQPQETRFFLVIAAFGIVIGIIYWFVSYEVAGTILLLAFGIAPGLIALRLMLDPATARVRGRVHRQSGDDPIVDLDAARHDTTGAGAGGIDRPFLDESGRLPSPTLAPFALGLGVATMVTGVIFGPAPVVAGIVPFVWGAWAWLHGAREEFDAVAAAGDPRAGEPRVRAGEPRARAGERSDADATPLQAGTSGEDRDATRAVTDSR